MRPEKKDGAENPIGLYKDPQSGQVIGALNEVQGDAAVRLGFTLWKEGYEFAKMTDAQIAELDKPQSAASPKKEAK